MHSCVHLGTVYDRQEKEAAYVVINSIDRWINNRVRIYKSKAYVTKSMCTVSQWDNIDGTGDHSDE